MSISLQDPETDRLARAVASLTGESLTVAIRTALAERLERETVRHNSKPRLAEQLVALGRDCAGLPDIDPRTPDEIVGYDETRSLVMVIDTSAIAAILFDEPDAAQFADVIESTTSRLISAVTWVETGVVVEGRKGRAGRESLERFLTLISPEIVTVSAAQAEIALEAFRRFGKGRHRAAP